MGCIVNGPGEAKDSDIGVDGGIGEAILLKKGTVIKRIKEKETGQYFKYDVLIFKHDSVLTELTGNLKPSELLKEMHRLSRL